MSSGEAASGWRNADRDWDRWPVPVYLAENYRNLHESGDAVITHHSAAYRELAAGSIGRAVEIGTGPNLYPLFLASGAARRIDAVDRSEAGLGYLRRQLTGAPDPIWEPYWHRCRALNPTLPATMTEALGRVHVVQGDMGRYELGDGSRWPGIPVDGATVARVVGPLTEDLRISRIDADPGLPAYGYTGMVLMRARRRAGATR